MRADAPCTHHNGRICGAIPTRRYIQGRRCSAHTPAALAGEPEPPEGTCAPGRCYCGKPDCPAYLTYGRDSYNNGETVVDIRAKASGRRRSSLEDFRAAQAVVGEQKTREQRLRRPSGVCSDASQTPLPGEPVAVGEGLNAAGPVSLAREEATGPAARTGEGR